MLQIPNLGFDFPGLSVAARAAVPKTAKESASSDIRPEDTNDAATSDLPPTIVFNKSMLRMSRSLLTYRALMPSMWTYESTTSGRQAARI